MTYVSKLNSSYQENGNQIFDMQFTDGTNSFNKQFAYPIGSINITSLKQSTAQILTDLNNPPTLPAPGVFDVTIPVIAQTAQQIARAAFQSDLALLNAMQRAITLGLKTSADADVAAQIAKIKAGLSANPAFISLI